MRYFLFGRPFRFLPTSGLYFMVLGEGLILASNTVRLCLQGWPTEPLDWAMCALAITALLLLALVVHAAAREYVGRSDKPARFWQFPRLNAGRGEENGGPAKATE